MITVSFPNWSDALAAADLSAKERNRHRVIINWFLGYLKQEHTGASKASARAFMDYLIETRKPADWQVQQWCDGLNWSRKETSSPRD